MASLSLVDPVGGAPLSLATTSAGSKESSPERLRSPSYTGLPGRIQNNRLIGDSANELVSLQSSTSILPTLYTVTMPVHCLVKLTFLSSFL